MLFIIIQLSCTRSANNDLEIFNTALNFLFIVSELVYVNPDDSLAECVNL